MTIVDMLGQSSVLTLLGMGIVFGFLIIMVCAITVAGKLIHAVGADKDTAAAAPARAGTSAGGGNGAAVTAAISAAVNEYRAKQ